MNVMSQKLHRYLHSTVPGLRGGIAAWAGFRSEVAAGLRGRHPGEKQSS